jgi:hypothetical protein
MENGEATPTDEPEHQALTPDIEGTESQDDHLQLLETLSSDGFIDRFERGVENYKKWQSACFRLTATHHWLNQGSKEKPVFYLDSAGSEALMVPLGISYDQPKIYRVDKTHPEHGAYYVYFVEGSATSTVLKCQRFVIGAASSLDKFFAANAAFDPERDEGHVMKKALSNWEVNVVGRLAGIRRPSAETLGNAGIDVQKIMAIDYSGGSDPKRAGQTISEPQAKRLYAIAKNIDQDRVKAYLKYRGYESSKAILRKDYDSIVNWAESGGPDWDQVAQQPSANEQAAKDMKERHKKASPEPEAEAAISKAQQDQLITLLEKQKLTAAQLNDFLKQEKSCLLHSIPELEFGEVQRIIESGELLGWVELGQPRGPE